MSSMYSDPRPAQNVRQVRATSPTPGEFTQSLAVATTPTVQAVDSITPVAQGFAQTVAAAAGLASELGQQAERDRAQQAYRDRINEARAEQLRQQGIDVEKAIRDEQEKARKTMLAAMKGESDALVESQLTLYKQRIAVGTNEDKRRTLMTDVAVEDVPAAAADFVRTLLPPDAPDEVVADVVNKWTPNFVAAIVDGRTNVVRERSEAVAGGLAAAVVGADDPAAAVVLTTAVR